MVQWQLLLEKIYPTFKHVAGTDNDTADALSHLDMNTKNTDIIDWESKQPSLTYKKEGLNESLCRNFIAMEYEDDIFDANNEQIITLSDATRIIDEEYKDSEFPLDVKMFHTHQQKMRKSKDKREKQLKIKAK